MTFHLKFFKLEVAVVKEIEPLTYSNLIKSLPKRLSSNFVRGCGIFIRQ